MSEKMSEPVTTQPPPSEGAPPGYGQPPPGYGQPPPAQGFGPPPPQGYGGNVPPGYPGPAQPMQQWMTKPTVADCPPGLEYLATIDQVLVKQQIELLEVVSGFECANKYRLLNTVGQQIYFAGEESGLCMRQCCGANRGFVMHITDNLGQEVIRIVRDFKFCVGCSWYACCKLCSMEISVEAPVGTVVGKVIQTCSFVQPGFDITTPDDEVVMKVRGPVCICDGPCCRKDQEFKVYKPDEVTKVGKISKQYAGFVEEMVSTADNFGVTFPMDLDVKLKATMIGAVFLIDFMFFETKNKK